MNYRKGFLYGLMIAAIIAVVAGLFAALFMQLWNWLIPIVFNGPTLTFWQAVGLLILAKLIVGFGGTGGNWHNKHKWKNRWNDKWSERCAAMSDEDKEKWKSHFMHKWNCAHDEVGTSEKTPEEVSTTEK